MRNLIWNGILKQDEPQQQTRLKVSFASVSPPGEEKRGGEWDCGRKGLRVTFPAWILPRECKLMAPGAIHWSPSIRLFNPSSPSQVVELILFDSGRCEEILSPVAEDV